MEEFSPGVLDAYRLIIGKLTSWGRSLIALLPNAVVAIIVFSLFLLIARIVRRGVMNLCARFSLNLSISQLFGRGAFFAVMAAGLFIALSILELDKAVTSLLAGVGILGLALGFAFQDIASNFISSILLITEKPFREGDIIETAGMLGVVVSVDLRTTKMRSFDGQEILIPNMQVFKATTTNYTIRGERRIGLRIGVAYETDLRKALTLTRQTIEQLPFLMAGKAVEVEYTGFGASSIDLDIRFWVTFPTGPIGFGDARTEAIIKLKEAYDQADINIPFAITTLDIPKASAVQLADALTGNGQKGDN